MSKTVTGRYKLRAMGIDEWATFPGWTAHVTAYAAWMIAAHRSPSTVELRTYHLRRIAGAHGDPWAVTVDELTELLAHPSWSAETKRSYRASWGTFYGWAHATGRTDTNPARLLPTIAPPRGLPRPVPEDRLRDALHGADDRLRLMLLLASHAGLRRAEIAQVHTDDIEADLLGLSLRVRGKGDRVRRVPLSTSLGVLLTACPVGYVFPSPHGGHLSPAYVGKLLSRALGDGWTAHTARHRFASRAYAAERDLRAVQELLGHAKPETTARYTAVPLDAARRAVDAAAL